MRPRFLSALALSLAIAPALAQSYGPPLGTLGLSFDPASAQRRLQVAAMENFDWYVWVEIDFGSAQQNQMNGLLIWEASLVLPPEITVLSVEFVAAVSFCDACSSTDWRALLGRCVFAKETPALLMHYEGRLLQDLSDLEIALAPASPSNFDGTAPGWRVCANSGNGAVDLHPFASGWTQPLLVNSSVGDARSSWSAVKARY